MDVVEQDMRGLIEAMKENRELSAVLASPVVRPEKKEAILRSVFAACQPLTVSFMALLAQKGTSEETVKALKNHLLCLLII